MSTRQEPDSTTKTDQTSGQESLSRIDVLASELDQFLKPGGMMLITDQETQDIDFLKSARHLIRLKNIQLTSALVKLQLQELQEKESYLFPKKEELVSNQQNSTLNVTGPFTHHRGEDTTKQTKNMRRSKSALESKSSTSKQTNSTENMQ